MAGGQFFSVRADRRLLKNLATLDKKIAGKVTREALRAEAKEVLKVLKPMLPRLTGATRKLARVRAMKRKKGRVGFSVLLAAKQGATDTFYAPFVDLGTKRIKARQNVRRAFKQTREAAAARIRARLKAGIDQAAKGN